MEKADLPKIEEESKPTFAPEENLVKEYMEEVSILITKKFNEKNVRAFTSKYLQRQLLGPKIDDEFEEDEQEDPRAKGMGSFKKVFINPIIEEEQGEEWAFNEGCLSIPEIREEVYRKEKIVVSYYNENWELKEESYDGYSARIIQHEYDHLDGILFTDHLTPLKKRLLSKKLQNISKGEVDVKYKMKFPIRKKQRK